jgi:hypothetical protein
MILSSDIIARPSEDGFEIVAGNRKLGVCRHSHWKCIPDKVKELSKKMLLKYN